MGLFSRRERPYATSDERHAEALAFAIQAVGRDRDLWMQADDLPLALFDDCHRGAQALLQALYATANGTRGSTAEHQSLDVAFGPGIPEMGERFAAGLSDLDGTLNCFRLAVLVLAAETTIRAFDDPIERESRVLSMRYILSREACSDRFCDAAISGEVPKDMTSDPDYAVWVARLFFEAAVREPMRLAPAANPWLVGVYGPCLQLGRGVMAGLSPEEAYKALQSDGSTP